MPKLVYIAHPYKDDPERNKKKISMIAKKIHRTGVIPFCPYFVYFDYLNDNIPEQRDIAISAAKEYFRRRSFDELWLYGSTISSGMETEIIAAYQFGIPVVCKNRVLEKAFETIKQRHNLSDGYTGI